MPHLPDFLYKFFDANDQSKAATIAALLASGNDYISLVGAIAGGGGFQTLAGAGGDPLGVEDSSVAMQTAIDALPNGGVLLMEPGSYLWFDSVPKLPKDLPAPILILAYGATVTLTADTPRFLDLNRTANNDTFQNIYVWGVTVDCDNVGGSSDPCVLGTVQGGATHAQVNLDNIELRDITTVNVPVDESPSGAVDNRSNVVFSVYRSATGTGIGPENTVTRIRCINVKMNGGNQGIFVGATGPNSDGLAVYVDDVLFDNCHWDSGVIPTALFPCNGFQVGSRAYGGKAVIRNCTARGSGDDGIEVNGLNDITVEDCTVYETAEPYLFTNFHTPEAGVEGQVVRFVRCAAVTADLTEINPYGFRFGENLGIHLGHLEYQGCRYYRTGGDLWGTDYATGEALGPVGYAGARLESLTVRDFVANIKGVTYSGDDNNYHAILGFDVRCPSVVVDSPRLRLQADMGGLTDKLLVGIWFNNGTGAGEQAFYVRTPEVAHVLTNDGGATECTRAIQLQGTVRGTIESPKLVAGCSVNPRLVKTNTYPTFSPTGPVRIIEPDASGVSGADVIISHFGDAGALKLAVKTTGRYDLTYGSTVNTPSLSGSFFGLTVTNGTAFTMAAPGQLGTTALGVVGQEISYEISNGSGGAMGAITWNAAFKLAGAFTGPANTKLKQIAFRHDGTNWVETWRSAGDIT